MNELEREMTEHLATFPERRKELLDFQKATNKNFEELKTQVKERLRHPEPAAKTIAMIGQVKDEMNDLKLSNEKWRGEILVQFSELIKNNERQNRVLFGDPQDKDDKGMHGMVKEMYTKLVQVDGVKGFFKWVVLTSSVIGALIYFKKI